MLNALPSRTAKSNQTMNLVLYLRFPSQLSTCFHSFHHSSSSPRTFSYYNSNFIPNDLFPLFTLPKLTHNPTETRSRTPCNIWDRLLELEMGKFCSFVPFSSIHRFYRFPIPFCLLSSSYELNLVAASTLALRSCTRSLHKTFPVRLRLRYDLIWALLPFPPCQRGLDFQFWKLHLYSSPLPVRPPFTAWPFPIRPLTHKQAMLF